MDHCKKAFIHVMQCDDCQLNFSGQGGATFRVRKSCCCEPIIHITSACPSCRMSYQSGYALYCQESGGPFVQCNLATCSADAIWGTAHCSDAHKRCDDIVAAANAAIASSAACDMVIRVGN